MAQVNILAYAARGQMAFDRNMNELNGYESFTTFFHDLSIAEFFGPASIKDTFERVVREWGMNHTYFTEFVLALNQKCWEWYERGGETEKKISSLYADLYYKAVEYIDEHWTGEEHESWREYYYRWTD